MYRYSEGRIIKQEGKYIGEVPVAMVETLVIQNVLKQAIKDR